MLSVQLFATFPTDESMPKKFATINPIVPNQKLEFIVANFCDMDFSFFRCWNPMRGAPKNGPR